MLLLSEKESFGLVLLEAMACGVPSIGTNVGGIPEVIEPGVTGYLSEVGEVETSARQAISILADKDLHKRFSENSMNRVKQFFSSSQIVEQYEELYMKLIKT
jgi:glycosyltransferase involved in cell wall biosynthesis